MWRVQVGTHHDVRAFELRPRAKRLDQRRPAPGVRDHDLGRALLDEAHDLRGLVGAPQLQARGGEHLPRGVADLLEAEHDDGVALVDEPVQRARTATPSG